MNNVIYVDFKNRTRVEIEIEIEVDLELETVEETKQTELEEMPILFEGAVS